MADLISRIEGVKKKLEEVDYIAVAQNLSLQKCSFITPNSLEFASTNSLYNIIRNKVHIVTTTNDCIINEYDISVKSYILRCVIFADILAKCNVIGYCPGVIIFRDKAGIDINENQFLDGIGKIKDEDIQKDITLRDLIVETISKNTLLNDVAKQYNVLEGYEMCCQILGFTTNGRKQVD
jgi:hypothetical protein